MAGAGYKLFNTGDVLTAAQVNTYLNEQTVMVFANSTARTSALSGVLAEGMMSYLQDTNAVEVYNGTSWVNVGNAGDITEVQAGVGISIASGTGPIPVITNSSTDLITTAGDILYGTAADTMARLGIGTAGQVLKVNSGATAPEWGAAGGASALTFITSYTFSNVATAIIDGCFTSTYNSYLINIEQIGAGTANDDLQMQLRYSGPTTQTAAYYGASGGGKYDSATFQNAQNNNTAQFTIATDISTSTTQGASGFLIISKVGVSAQPSWAGSFVDEAAAVSRNVGGLISATQTWTGILFKSSSSNIYGTIRVYGLAKS